jgi:hypothetical protein
MSTKNKEIKEDENEFIKSYYNLIKLIVVKLFSDNKTRQKGGTINDDEESGIGPITSKDSAGAILISTIDTALKGVINITDTYVTPLIKPFVNDILSSVLGVDFNSIESGNWDKVAPLMRAEIKAKADDLDKIMKDPEIQAAFKKLIETYAQVAFKTLEISKPILNEIVDKILQTSSDVLNQTVIGATNTGLNVVEAAIGEIPVAGGIIDLTLAIGRGINAGVKAILPLLNSSIDMFAIASNSANKMIDGTTEVLNKVKETKKSLNETMNRISTIPNIQYPSSSSIKIGGAERKKYKHINNKIKRTTLRIKKSLNLFFNKKKDNKTRRKR